MKTLLKIIAVLFLFSLSNLVTKVAAQNFLSYPIADLGSCRDARECYLYCQIPQNKAACWSYAKYVAPPNVLGVTTMSEAEKQQMEAKAKQYNVVFPIPELNNCAGPQQCRDFCEQPANQTACMNFARKKGFAKEMEQPPDDGIPEEKRQVVMQSAQSELGCTSMESCRKVCEQDQNKCEAFAKKHGLVKEPPAEERQKMEAEKIQLMKVAREDLGCDSMESCRNFCEKNPKRCMDFAKKRGFDQPDNEPPEEKRGELRPGLEDSSFGRGPGIRPACAGEESCKKYCQEHPDECPGFQGKPALTPAGGQIPQPSERSFNAPSAGFVGPTGCKTEAECKSFCQSNPDKCPGFQKDEEKLRIHPSYAPIKPTSGEYKGPMPYQYQQGSGSSSGPTPQSTNVQNISVPQAYPSYAPQPSYSPQPTP